MLNSSENIKKRAFMGTEKLLAMGGFVEEALVDIYKLFYSPEVISAVRKYAEPDMEFWVVADAVDRHFDLEERAIRLDIVKYRSEDFMVWWAENMAKQEVAHLRRIELEREEEAKYKPEIKKALAGFSSLDKRIIKLRCGLDGGKKLRPGQIARLPEFDCPVAYIKDRLEDINLNNTIRKTFGDISGKTRAQKEEKDND